MRNELLLTLLRWTSSTKMSGRMKVSSMDQLNVTPKERMARRKIMSVKKEFGLLFLIILVNIQPACSLENYEYREGTNAIINFLLELEYSTEDVAFEMFTLNSEQPFYTNNELNPDALLPEQQGRFNVTSSKSGRDLTVNLTIYKIQKTDEGVYILIVQEMNDEIREHILDANLEVILPGLAECSVVDSDYSTKLNQVHCQAAFGSDDTDSIMCYQNSEKALLYGPIARSDTHIAAVFWMYIDSPIFCCTIQGDSPINEGSCSDFTYIPPGFHSSTTASTERSPNISPTPSNTKSTPEKNENSTDSDNTLLKCPTYNAITTGMLAGFITAFSLSTLLIFVLLLKNKICIKKLGYNRQIPDHKNNGNRELEIPLNAHPHDVENRDNSRVDKSQKTMGSCHF